MKLTLRPTRRRMQLLYVGLFAIQASILSFSPLTTFAAAPQDTYSWVKSMGVPGCIYDVSMADVTIANGKVYALDTGNQVVNIFDTNGSYVGMLGSNGSGNGQFTYLNSIATDASGNIYVTDTNYSSLARVQKFSPTGAYIGQFGSWGSGNGQFTGFGGITVDSSGNVYVADSGNKRVEKFDSNGNYLLQFGSNGSGNGQFTYMGYEGDIAADITGNIYVVDTNYSTYSRVQKFSSNGTYISQFGSYGTGVGQLGAPNGIAIDSAGSIYVTDQTRIEKFDSIGTYMATIGSSGSGNGQINGAGGVSIDSTGNIYLAELSNKRIQKFDAMGTYVWQATHQPGDPTMLCGPQGAAVGPDGNLYVLDGRWWWAGWDNIKVYSPSGALVRTMAANGSGNGQLSSPSSIVFDKAGNFYVVDQGNKRVEKFDTNGNYLSQFGSSGTGNGQFTNPYGIAIDSTGNIYVSDQSYSPTASRVEKFDGNGNYISQFGSRGTGNGQFNFAAGIAIDATGSIYVVDTNNSRVEKFDSNGNYISQFGSSGTGPGHFNTAYGIGIDASGNIYVSDAYNLGIQKFDSNGIFLTSFDGYNTGDHPYNGGTVGLALDNNGTVYGLDNGSADNVNSRISVWNAPIAPSPPQNISAIMTSTSSLKISWSQPAHFGTSPFLGYRIMYRMLGTSTWAQAATVPPSTLTFSLANLSPAATYDIQVIAYNAVGTSIDTPSQIYSAMTSVDMSVAMLADTGENMGIVVGVSLALLAVGAGLMIIRRVGR